MERGAQWGVADALKNPAAPLQRRSGANKRGFNVMDDRSVDLSAQGRAGNVIDLSEYRDAAGLDNFADGIRDRTLRRIRLLRQALDRIEPSVAATVDSDFDEADVGTDELLSLAGLWFGWAFNPPPPPRHWRTSRRDEWRDWCRRAAAPS